MVLAAAPSAAVESGAPRCATGQCVEVTAAHLLGIASEVGARDPERARVMLTAVLKDREPDARAQARFQLALLAEKAGDLPGAERWLRALLDEKPGASVARLELGRILAVQKKNGAAVRELQRAHAAGLPPDVAKTVEPITSLLRSEAPFGGSFELAVAPDTNINRATRSDTLTIFGLPFAIDEAAKARSGVGLAYAGQLFARPALAGQRFTVALSGQGNLYRRGAANELTLGLSAGPQFRLGAAQLSASAVASRGSLGGERAATGYGLDVKARLPLGQTSALAVSAAALKDDNARQPLGSGMSYALQLAVEKALSPRLYARANASFGRLDAKAAPLSSWSYGGGLTLSRQFGRFTGYAGAEVRRLEGDAPFFVFGSARRDTLLQGTAGLIVRPLTIGGFAPVVRLTRARNLSPIEIYRYKRNRLEFGITRDF